MAGHNSSTGAVFVSLVMIMAVAALVLFLPPGMGPLQPPSLGLLLIFPLVLVAVFILLSRASNASNSLP